MEARLIILITLCVGLTACGDDVSVEPVTASGSALCVADFEQCVNPVFDAVITASGGQATCAGSGCHDVNAGSGGAFKVFPQAEPGSPEMMSNFFAAKGFANLNDPDQSKLLLEPLRGVFAISGTHTGGDIFPNTADACYGVIHDWISIRVEDSNASSCGFCTPVDVSTCGF